jgi:hypothetical protein
MVNSIMIFSELKRQLKASQKQKLNEQKQALKQETTTEEVKKPENSDQTISEENISPNVRKNFKLKIKRNIMYPVLYIYLIFLGILQT